MQSEKSMVPLEEQQGRHAHAAQFQTDKERRTPYKGLFFVTFALLLLSCGYILGSDSASKAAPVPSTPQTTSEAKEASASTRSVAEIPAEQNLKAVGETTAEIKAEKSEARPVVATPTTPVTPAVQAILAPDLAEVAKDQNKSKLYGFPLSEKSNLTVVFLTCCGRHDMLEEVLLAFIEFNEFPFKKLIVVNDGPTNLEVSAIAVKFPNLTLLSTGEKGGQLRAIDAALRLVDTPYVYYSEDDFKLVHSGLVTLNIQELEKDPMLLQMWNGFHKGPRYINGTNIVDNTWPWAGFSLQPSVWRMSDYFLIEGGFAKFTNDQSRGMGAGYMEQRIVEEYRAKGFFVRKTAIDYVLHLGENRGLPRKTRR